MCQMQLVRIVLNTFLISKRFNLNLNWVSSCLFVHLTTVVGVVYRLSSDTETCRSAASLMNRNISAGDAPPVKYQRRRRRCCPPATEWFHEVESHNRGSNDCRCDALWFRMVLLGAEWRCCHRVVWCCWAYSDVDMRIVMHLVLYIGTISSI